MFCTRVRGPPTAKSIASGMLEVFNWKHCKLYYLIYIYNSTLVVNQLELYLSFTVCCTFKVLLKTVFWLFVVRGSLLFFSKIWKYLSFYDFVWNVDRARKANAGVTFNCLTFFQSDNVQQFSIVFKYLTFTYQYQWLTSGEFYRVWIWNVNMKNSSTCILETLEPSCTCTGLVEIITKNYLFN